MHKQILHFELGENLWLAHRLVWDERQNAETPPQTGTERTEQNPAQTTPEQKAAANKEAAEKRAKAAAAAAREAATKADDENKAEAILRAEPPGQSPESPSVNSPAVDTKPEGEKPDQAAKDAKDQAAKAVETATRAAETGGIAVTLERFMKKITELFEKLGVEMEKLFKGFEKKPEPKFSQSPIGNNDKFSISESFRAGGEGIKLKLDAPNSEVKAVSGGKVIKVEEDRVVLEVGSGEQKSQIVYKGLSPTQALVGTEVQIGALLGKSKTDSLNFQILDPGKKQVDPTSLLRDFIKT